MNRFYLKIILPSILSILFFTLTIFLIIIPHFQQNIMNGKREMIKELTNSAWSILSKYENDERNGLLTREEAQKTAVSRIEYLRYGDENKDYFWITDMHPQMIMHPYRSDLNGKDLSDFIDPHGKRFFVDFVNVVKASDHGYVDYMWQWKDDSLHIVPKLSYVRLFKPWNWVIGTGVYIEDVKKEIKALTKKLVWISIFISILIASLLLYISQQSLKIEKGRLDAEKSLQISKDRYKTLVEAATEGLIMLIDGRISFLNNVICKMTGYESGDLINFSIAEFIGENNNKDIVDAFSKNIIKEGQYEINLKKKEGGFIEALVTSSTTFLYEKQVNVIIVKDITLDKRINTVSIDYQKLINSVDLGFFRIRIDNKGKFILANETALRILGCADFSELTDITIFDLFISLEERKSIRNDLLEHGFIKNRLIRIRKINGEYATLTITLVGIVNDNSERVIFDGMVEDISLQETFRAESIRIISELKAGSFMMEQSLKPFSDALFTIDSDSTIKQAIDLLPKFKTDCLLVTKGENIYIGIITSTDIQKRVLGLKLSLDNPVYLIMSAPITSVLDSMSVAEGIRICEDAKINHLVLRDESDTIYGVLNLNKVYRALKDSLYFFNTNISKAQTIEEIRACYKSMQLFIKPLIISGLSVAYVTNITSAFSDALTRRIIDLAIEQIGKPPVDFAFICMGSEGRSEETLFTDQDNAIIFEKPSNDNEKHLYNYFNKLGTIICNDLDFVGYTFCKGNIMAKNPQWSQPIDVWEKYFANWITTPDPQNLLDASIFFDFRCIYGEDFIVDRLRKNVKTLIKASPLFRYHMANNAYSIKLSQIGSSGIIGDKNNDLFDLKYAVSIIIIIARVYALNNDISVTNTLERLSALKAKQIISPTTIDEMYYVYDYLMKLRLKNQIYLNDNHLPLSNTINVKKMLDVDLSILKKVLSLIPSYQNKIALDFKLSP